MWLYKSEDKTKKLLESALRELIAFKAKYSMLSEIANVIKAIDEVQCAEAQRNRLATTRLATETKQESTSPPISMLSLTSWLAKTSTPTSLRRRISLFSPPPPKISKRDTSANGLLQSASRQENAPPS